MKKQLRLSETLHDLQRLDAQLVKHICEMEEFEAASKQDRYEIYKLLDTYYSELVPSNPYSGFGISPSNSSCSSLNT